MPRQIFRGRLQAGKFVELEWLLVKLRKHAPVRRRLGEASDGDVNTQFIALRNHRPQSGVEHPVGVGGEGETVAGIVVAAFGVLMDVGGLDDVIAALGMAAEVAAFAPLAPRIHGCPAETMDHMLNLAFPGIDSEALIVALKDLVAISNGSACTSSSYTPCSLP